ncbi:hypothetical protein [Streptomyces europaeiscabiei]|uniref:hypothetical protein n=1 Tax=Streptomyces europaeiscabiei TaxID=146819 RepID=UPI001C1E51AC|nr:hypothetical protein [Streptomyces europaeiscabiei]
MDLSDIQEDWGPDCFVIVTLATRRESREFSDKVAELQESNKLDDDAAMDLATEVCKRHFVRGSVQVLTESGEYEKSDMQPDDFDLSVDLVNKVFAAISGMNYDPKDSRSTASNEGMPVSDEKNSEMSSSTNSEQPSPKTS